MTFWTDERDAEARQLWADGVSASVIAGVIGASSRNAVIGRAHRQGWSRAGEVAVAKKVNGFWLVPRRPPAPRLKQARPVLRAPRVIQAKGRRGVPLLEARHGQCRYLLAGSPDWLMCGLCTIGGTSWCCEHVKIVFTKGQ